MTAEPELRATLVRLISIELAAAEADVIAARSLREDLGMDSIAAANILFALEEEDLGVEIKLSSEIDTLDQLEAAVRVWLAATGRTI